MKCLSEGLCRSERQRLWPWSPRPRLSLGTLYVVHCVGEWRSCVLGERRRRVPCSALPCPALPGWKRKRFLPWGARTRQDLGPDSGRGTSSQKKYAKEWKGGRRFIQFSPGSYKCERGQIYCQVSGEQTCNKAGILKFAVIPSFSLGEHRSTLITHEYIFL